MKKVELQHSGDGKWAEEREGRVGSSGGEGAAVGGGVPLGRGLADWS